MEFIHDSAERGEVLPADEFSVDSAPTSIDTSEVSVSPASSTDEIPAPSDVVAEAANVAEEPVGKW